MFLLIQKRGNFKFETSLEGIKRKLLKQVEHHNFQLGIIVQRLKASFSFNYPNSATEQLL